MSFTLHKTALASAISALLVAPTIVHATNGMLMEGYGPESTAMGGTSMAFDNGVGGMVNNPATLSMMGDGQSRFDVSIGNLRPDVSATVTYPDGSKHKADSSGDSYIMPAIGWATRKGQMTYGVGVFSQGGMGTEYDKASALQGARSEVGVGALLVPLSYNVNDKLNVGGTVQYVWGGMDLIMGMPVGDLTAPQPGTFADFMPGAPNSLGSAEGTLINGLAAQIQGGALTLAPNDSAVFNFSNDSDFSGETTGAGISGKLGFTYQVTPELTIGGAYQLKTAMSDFEGNGTMDIVKPDGTSALGQAVPGKYTIKDFQFPSTLSIGLAYTVDKWLLAADITQINWSDVMADFKMNFTVDANVPGFGGASTDIVMLQEWDDQTVLKLGAAYAVNKDLTVRFGANLASNPVPDKYLNALFPAIIENHYTLGGSYVINDVHVIGASLAIAPEVTQTNSLTQVTSTHAQTNLQVMYSYKF